MLKYRVTAVVAGAALALTACGGKGQVATTKPSTGTTGNQAELVSVLQGARTKAVARRTARFTQTVSLTPVTGTAQTITISGSMDVPDHRIEMALTLPRVGNIEAVLDGTTIYEKIPQLSTTLGGKPWIKIDPASLSKAGGGQFAALLSGLEGSLKQVQSQDPTSGLSLLSGVSGPVTAVGSETVRGVATTHYRFAIDTAKALAQLPADLQAAITSFTSQLGITSSLPAEAWIDADGLTRRIHLTIDRANPDATPTPLASGLPAVALPKSTEVTMELYDYGAAISVTVPPADQVTDLGAMLSQMGGGG